MSRASFSYGDAGMAPPDPAAVNLVGAPTNSIDQLNSFLRGEIAAAETYRMAIDKFTTENACDSVGLLTSIQEEHARASQALRDRIRELGGDAADSSGTWGAWAKFVQATSQLFGVTSALKGLKEGEEHGLKDYEGGISDLDESSAELVQNQLIPAQTRHINLLDQMITCTSGA